MIFLPAEYWEIRQTREKGRGVFAKKDIEPGMIIGDYLGKMIHSHEEEIYEKENELYLMYYHDRASIYPYIKQPGIHVINHSCTPNTWMTTYRGHTLYFSLRKIFAGEELTVSYLIAPDKTCDPCCHGCVCESSMCTKTMHLTKKRYEAWDEFNIKEMESTKRERVKFGKDLEKLDEYPTTIPDDSIYTLFGNTAKTPKVLDNTQLPSKKELRKLIRQTGRTLYFPKLNKTVLGLEEDKVFVHTDKNKINYPQTLQIYI